MDRFQPRSDKRKPMLEVVSYHGRVPLERGLCYCLHLVAAHFHVDLDDALISASREERHIHAHNREYGTNLHSQPWLIQMHELNPRVYAPANPVDQTSHCLRSDNNACYVRATNTNTHASAGQLIAWFQRGLDFKSNALAVQFVHMAARLKLDFVTPYHSGSEMHHVVGAKNPITVLQSHNIIAKR